jgi:ABC-type sugar transport system ATPase subunit
MSLARFRAERRDGGATLAGGELRIDVEREIPFGDVILGARAEHTRLWEDGAGLVGPFDARVDYVEALGRETLIGISARGDHRFIVEADGRVRVEPGDAVQFGFRRGSLHLFDAADERALGRV